MELGTIFEKSRRAILILKIFWTTPQFVQNLTPIRKLFYTFYTNAVITQDPPRNISENIKIKGPKNHQLLHCIKY